jgi:hypothetical protein
VQLPAPGPSGRREADRHWRRRARREVAAWSGRPKRPSAGGGGAVKDRRRALAEAGEHDRAVDEPARPRARCVRRFRDEERRQLGHRVHRRMRSHDRWRRYESLTERELQARLVVDRKTNPEIAFRAAFSRRPARHTSNIFQDGVRHVELARVDATTRTAS